LFEGDFEHGRNPIGSVVAWHYRELKGKHEMDSERWGQIEALYHAALERGEGERRAAFLQEACGEDQELRREVESLLSSGAAAGTCMAAAAMEVAAEALVARRAGKE
jgi:hypothetical protein